MKRRWRGVVHCLVGVALVVGLLVYGLSLDRRSDQPVTPVRLSVESGFYDSPFYLEMACDRGEIRYTLDSTEPDENSILYTEPILIEDASGNPNVYSMIEDVCIELRSDILALSGREPKYGFKTPVEPVDKATVIRAVCIDAFGNRSDIINAVYFVGFDQKEAYDGMNIISITTNPGNLFDFDKGIYVLGKTFDETLVEAGGVPPALPNLGNWAGNYKNKGKEWEREAHICFFDADRNLKLSGHYGIRIQGGASRYMLPKSLNLYARKRYGAESIPAQPLFGEDWQLHSVNLNAGGQGVDTKIHDPLVNTLAAGCNFLTREYEPYELFLDGEYWGVYWLTPRFKKDYFENKYGIRDGDVIETKVDHIEEGTDEDYGPYKEMLRLIADNDMSDEANYAKRLRGRGHGELDRLLRDGALHRQHRLAQQQPLAVAGSQCAGPARLRRQVALGDVRCQSVHESRTGGRQLRHPNDKAGPIFSSLMDNMTFRNALYARMVDFANDTFNPERVNAFVDDYAARMRHAMGNEYKRFMHDKTEEDFIRSCEDIKTFFQLRHDNILEAFGGK